MGATQTKFFLLSKSSNKSTTKYKFLLTNAETIMNSTFKDYLFIFRK